MTPEGEAARVPQEHHHRMRFGYIPRLMAYGWECTSEICGYWVMWIKSEDLYARKN